MPHTKGVLVESAGPSNIFTDDCDLANPGLREIEHLGSLVLCRLAATVVKEFAERSLMCHPLPLLTSQVSGRHLLAREYKLIAVGVSENRPRAPDLHLRLLGQRDTLSLERIRGSEHVLAPEGHGLKPPDSVF